VKKVKKVKKSYHNEEMGVLLLRLLNFVDKKHNKQNIIKM
jgi:hypothetical protein